MRAEILPYNTIVGMKIKLSYDDEKPAALLVLFNVEPVGTLHQELTIQLANEIVEAINAKSS